MFCSKCGHIMRSGTKVCPSCGARQSGQKSRVNKDCDHAHAGSSLRNSSLLGAAFRAFTRMFDFRGRSAPREFWAGYLLIAVIYALLILIPGDYKGIAMILFILPTISLLVRRLHDVGKKGTFVLLMLVPGIGTLFLMILCLGSSDGANEWGQHPYD